MGPCTVVAKGGVGESGASAMVHHSFDEKINKNMVLRTGDTSLCPNTGVIAVLIVEGQIAAQGIITNKGSSISAEVGPGQQVIGIVHTIPLFNEIACKRLGELSFTLEECDFV